MFYISEFIPMNNINAALSKLVLLQITESDFLKKKGGDKSPPPPKKKARNKFRATLFSQMHLLQQNQFLVLHDFARLHPHKIGATSK